MQMIHFLFRFAVGSGALVAAISASGCAKSTRPPAPPIDAAVESSPGPRPDYIPVVRYGRYTLVELAPASAQQDLMQQVIDVTIPHTRTATVGDALRHVLARSGYQLCTGPDIASLSALPLPAAHYRLGPTLLRDALLTLAGPAWDLQVDDRARRVCFIRAVTPSQTHSSVSPSSASVSASGAVERRPLPEVSLP